MLNSERKSVAMKAAIIACLHAKTCTFVVEHQSCTGVKSNDKFHEGTLWSAAA